MPHGGDPNLRYCLDTTLAWLLNSTSVWEGTSRLHFFITLSNDIDLVLGTSLVGRAGESKWMSMLRTFTRAMSHPRYLLRIMNTRYNYVCRICMCNMCKYLCVCVCVNIYVYNNRI